MRFLICSHCQRHVKDTDSSCPFCASSLDRATPAGNASVRHARSRLAVLFGATTALVTSAAAATSCGGSTTSNVDAGPSPTSTQTATPAYGVAVPPQDAGAKDSGTDSGSAVAAYGAAQLDSGSD